MKRDDAVPSKQSSHSNAQLVRPTGRYATTDLSLSAFLQTLGHEIIDVRSERGRGVFVFADSPELRKDILRWGNNEPVLIKVRGYVNNLRDLKGVVGQ